MHYQSSPNRLKLFRLQHGLSQKQLAALTGLDRSMISVYERGRAIPPLPVAGTLQLFFGVGLAELFPQLFSRLQKELAERQQRCGYGSERRRVAA